jgi:type IV secretory pathway VirB4 component
MMTGTDVIVIDPENEYQHLAEAVGGAYLKISLTSPSRINPFDLPRNSEDPIADTIRSAVIQIKAMISLMVGKLDATEDSMLDNALIETYAKKDITENTQSLERVEFPTMSDLGDILNNVSGGESLAQRISKYTVGTFAGLLDKPTNIDLTKQLVVFNIRDLEDELRPIAMFLVLSYIWNVTRSSLKKRLLFIDEAWWMMQYEDSAKFLFGLAKRARKYYLGVTVISQDVADFLASDYGRAVVNNASLYVLLKQSPASIDIITQTFSLTRYERQLLLQSGVGQGIFFAGQRHVAIQVAASPREDQIITSDPRQLLQIREAKKEYAEAMRKSEQPEVEDVEDISDIPESNDEPEQK